MGKMKVSDWNGLKVPSRFFQALHAVYGTHAPDRLSVETIARDVNDGTISPGVTGNYGHKTHRTVVLELRDAGHDMSEALAHVRTEQRSHHVIYQCADGRCGSPFHTEDLRDAARGAQKAGCTCYRLIEVKP